MACPHFASQRHPVGPIMPVCTRVPRSEAERIGPVDGPDVVYKLLAPRSVPLKHERAWLLLLQSDKFLAVENEIGQGIVDEVEVDLDWALRCARLPDTPFAILAHNHPSGSSWPSVQDGRLTRDMGAVAYAQGVELLDHVVLGRGNFYSFRYRREGRP